MAVVSEAASLAPELLARIQQELRAGEIEGWLLYNFHGNNPVASALLGLPPMTRRYFVLIPAEGPPVALTHRIEQQPWREWTGETRVYLGWRELEAELAEMLRPFCSVAMEYAAGDAVPYVDHLPAGVAEMVRDSGVDVLSSADLVSAFYARWTPEGEASHRRAAAVLQQTAREAFERIANGVRSGGPVTEWEMREWIRGRIAERGLRVEGDCIVAIGPNAANPHYAPSERESAPIGRDALVLIDLWGKESPGAIFADQTWMGYVGERAPERLREIWNAVRDARDAAVELLRSRHAAGKPTSGWEVDDAARRIIEERGYGEAFIHRTGHSIDRELHGSGPNIDNLETRDTRRLIPGVGFSIEPGIYLAGDVGFRSEIDVFMGPEGPEVTPPEPQRDLWTIPGEPRV